MKLTQADFFYNNLIKFQIFGVKIGIEAKDRRHLEELYPLLERIFPNGFEQVDDKEIEYHFLIKSKSSKNFDLYRNDIKLLEDVGEEVFFEMAESQIRLTIAEFAVGKVFLHAGVIGWKNRAIVIPAQSFAGKTTLVAALIKKGAVYYSDEYAVLDSEGNVQPFPKWLSIRGITDAYTQHDCPVEALGGRAGTKTIPVGMVLIARYRAGKKIPKRWNPKLLSGGRGIMEIIPHTMPLINKPREVLAVLNKLAGRAIIVRTVRGEADEFAETLLDYFDSRTI